MVSYSTQALDSTDYQIFLTLLGDPKATNTSISSVVGVSTETVRTRIIRLKKRGFLRPEKSINDPVFGVRTQSEVEAKYQPESLGLTRFHVFFNQVNNVEDATTLTSLFNKHPYTQYWSQCYGNGGAYYTRFDVPSDAIPSLKKFFNKVQELNLCSSVDSYRSDNRVESKVNFQQWDMTNQTWQIPDVPNSIGINPIENLWNYFIKEQFEPNQLSFNLPPTVDFDYLDLKLLRELTINSKLSLTSIQNFYDKDISTLSKRIKSIREQIATDDVLFYDRRVFDLTYAQCVVGQFPTSGITKEQLLSFVSSGLLPFSSDLTISDNYFIWYLSLPPFFTATLSEFIWKYLHLEKIYQLQLENTMRYYFYHENYDTNQGWKTSENYTYLSVMQ